eukprot:SAG22_NODE_1199_length_5185_cov_5.251278_4_plen_183_part_00
MPAAAKILLPLLAAAALLNVAAGLDIFAAVRMDDQGEIKKALAAGADINEKQPGSGQTPLMNAVLSGKTAAVKFLLKKGADVTIPEKDGYTPMHGAGFQGRADIAQLLIDAGVPVDDEHSDGHHPVVRACWGREQRHTDTVKVMLEAGATLKGNEQDLTSNPGTKAVLQEWAKLELQRSAEL